MSHEDLSDPAVHRRIEEAAVRRGRSALGWWAAAAVIVFALGWPLYCAATWPRP